MTDLQQGVAQLWAINVVSCEHCDKRYCPYPTTSVIAPTLRLTTIALRVSLSLRRSPLFCSIFSYLQFVEP